MFWLHIIHQEFFFINSFGFILLSSFMGQWSIVTVEYCYCGVLLLWSIFTVVYSYCGVSILWSIVTVEYCYCRVFLLWSIVTEAFWVLASVFSCWTTYIRILAFPFVLWCHKAVGIVRKMFRTGVMGTFRIANSCVIFMLG
jgi:hypothetical protein